MYFEEDATCEPIEAYCTDMDNLLDMIEKALIDDLEPTYIVEGMWHCPQCDDLVPGFNERGLNS